MPDTPTSTDLAAAAAGGVPVTVDEYRAEQVKEYGTYVAASPIDILGARAFNVGDAVPASHLDSGVVDPDQVHKITTKSGRVAAGLEKG